MLVVDDEADVRETLVDVLAWKGFDVREAANGQEAMDCLLSSRPCIILLDLMMPVMDGWEFCRRKTANPDVESVPVVIISGVSGLQNDTGSLHAAAVATKPVDMPALLEIVEEHCGRQAAPTRRH